MTEESDDRKFNALGETIRLYQNKDAQHWSEFETIKKKWLEAEARVNEVAAENSLLRESIQSEHAIMQSEINRLGDVITRLKEQVRDHPPLPEQKEKKK